MTAIPTETLQSLLPRTRRKPQREKDPFEIPSSSQSDLDDSAHAVSESTIEPRDESVQISRKRPTALNKTKTKPAAAPAKAKSQQKKSSTAVAKPKPSHPKSTPASSSRRRTYGRADSDKENAEDSYVDLPGEDISDDIIAPSTERSSVDPVKAKEIARLRGKFEDVDAWEMEFESVDMGGTSSPWR
jgi:hypothetical protein